MNFKTMSKQRKFVLIAAAIGLISCFLPWYTFSFMGFGGGSINGMHSWGLLTFLAFAGAGIVALLGDQTKTMSQSHWFLALACGVLSIIGVLIFFLEVSGTMVSYGFGLFIAAAAAIGVLAAAYTQRNPGDSIKGGFDSLKNDIDSKKKTDNTP